MWKITFSWPKSTPHPAPVPAGQQDSCSHPVLNRSAPLPLPCPTSELAAFRRKAKCLLGNPTAPCPGETSTVASRHSGRVGDAEIGLEFGRNLGLLWTGRHWAYMGPRKGKGWAKTLRSREEKRQGLAVVSTMGDFVLGVLDKDRPCGSL